MRYLVKRLRVIDHQHTNSPWRVKEGQNTMHQVCQRRNAALSDAGNKGKLISTNMRDNSVKPFLVYNFLQNLTDYGKTRNWPVVRA